METSKVLEENRNRVTAQHTATEHYYSLDGQGLFPSVTTVLSKTENKENIKDFYAWSAVKYLNQLHDEGESDIFSSRNRRDAAYHAEFIRNQAARIGTQVHNWIEDEEELTDKLRGEEDAKAVCGYRSYQRFKKDFPHLKILEQEYLVASDKLKVAGAIDIIGYDTKRKKIFLIDWKTSNAVHESYAKQLVTYRECLKDMTGIKAVDMYVVWLSKDTAYYELHSPVKPAKILQDFKRNIKSYEFITNGESKLRRVHRPQEISERI